MFLGVLWAGGSVLADKPREKGESWEVLVEKGRYERALDVLAERIGDLERELEGLEERKPLPRERIERVRRKLDALRGARERVLHRMREKREEAERRARQRAEEIERLRERLHKINRALDIHQARLKELLRTHGRNEQVEAEEREIRDLRRERKEVTGALARLELEDLLGTLREMGLHDRARELVELRREDPERFEDELRETAQWVRELEEMRRHDPEAFELHLKVARMERESLRLAEETRRAEGERREQLTEKLRSLLADIFDLKLRIHQREADRLERELARLRQRIEGRKRARKRIIEHRLLQLLGREEEWEW